MANILVKLRARADKVWQFYIFGYEYFCPKARKLVNNIWKKKGWEYLG